MVTMMITTTVFLLLILLVRGFFQKKISAVLQYSLWLFAVAKLLVFPMPVLESSFSVMNLFDVVTVVIGEAADGELAEEGMAGSLGNDVETHSQNGYAAMEGENTGQISDIQNDQPLQNGQQQNENQENQQQSASLEKETLSFLGKISQPEALKTIYIIWAAGSILVLVYMVFVNGRLCLSLKKNRILFDETESELPVYLVEGLPTPCLYGRGIYVPAELAGQEEKLHHVLVHETTHYKHGDGLWGMIRGICVAVYWWHPLVWFCAYLSMQDCEYACDETAIRQLGEQQRISYGKTILSLVKIKESAKNYFSMALLLSGGGEKMKKRITRIAKHSKGLAATGTLVVFLLVMGLAVTVTSGKENKVTDGAIETEKQDFEQEVSAVSEQDWKPEKNSGSYGWQVNENNQLLHKNPDTGEMEVAVELMDYVSEEEFVDCSFVDENTAYIAYFSKEKHLVVLQYTVDGAANWNKTILPGQLEMGVGGIFLSFVDETTGYLLVGSEPGAGKMKKTLYVTKDGGKSLEKVGKPDMRNHPCDMLFFTEDIGFMITMYYGEEPYMYQTTDGGASWNPVSVDIPEDEAFSYVNGYSLERKEGSKGEAKVILEGVGIEENVYLEYVTKDAGKTWD